MAQRAPNRLEHEKSPYLLQHAHNPVDWYPWGDEAFARARAEGKPLFVSVGYSTCHWCHVMERESFEDDDVAALLRASFISVKVDREERPDVDRVLMTAMQAMGRGGGWPLNCFLTPEGKPFFGGTYFPAHTLPGRIGMMELLPRIANAWREERAQLEANGERVIAMLAELSAGAAGDGASLHAFPDLLERCEQALERAYDPHGGGFGGAPKFPSTVNLEFLLRRWARDPERHALARDMVVRQLEAMQAGGIHDHLGGGFHRYATDREWLVPHFEKMLYDQALLATAYLEAHAATGRADFAATARGIFAYVARDLCSPDGAFLSAEDADSEGEEGRFYVWTPAQLEAALGHELAALFAHRYGVSERGNFEHATSILFEAHTLAQTATSFGLTPAETHARLEQARATLLALRATRPRPHRDDKVITAWNGLMIAACATATRLLGDPEYAAAAARAADFVWERLRTPDGALLRRWRDGDAAGAAQLDDHAYYAHGLLELFAATQDPRWLARAAQVTEAMLARFWDEQDGACFESPADDPLVPVRMKDGFDGAEMAGNSIAAANLLRLSSLLERADWRMKAERTLHHYAARLQNDPWAMPRMLVAMDLALTLPRHVVITGEASPARDALLAVFRAQWRPFDELLLVDDAARAALAPLAPFAAALQPLGGRPTAHVCVDRACQLPVTDPEAFAAQLAAPHPPSTME